MNNGYIRTNLCVINDLQLWLQKDTSLEACAYRRRKSIIVRHYGPKHPADLGCQNLIFLPKLQIRLLSGKMRAATSLVFEKSGSTLKVFVVTNNKNQSI